MDTPTLLFDRYRRRGDLDALGRAFDLLSPRLLALQLTGNAARVVKTAAWACYWPTMLSASAVAK